MIDLAARRRWFTDELWGAQEPAWFTNVGPGFDAEPAAIGVDGDLLAILWLPWRGLSGTRTRMSRVRALVPVLLLACNTSPAATEGDESGGFTETSGGSSESGEPVPPEPYVPIEGNAFPWSGESTDMVCDDSADNDDNGYTDCDDFSCSRNPSVFVCGADSVYESTPNLCANGSDDDGDGRVDCKDPDCFKNPFHDVCDKPRSDTDCVKDGDGDGQVGCDDLDCRIDVVACPPAAGSLRILFDQTIDETAGNGPNSDWVVDSWGRIPAPSNPLVADEWSGALSGFGFALYKGGHRIENLVAWDGRISFEDSNNPQDLALYDVVVLIEPSRRMRPDEKASIINYVRAGGGLLAVANHRSADRDGNGWSAPEIFNDMFDDNPVMKDPFGFRFDEVDVELETAIDNVLNTGHPVIDGPEGVVERIGFYIGDTARLTGSNPTAVGLVALDDSSKLVVGAVEVGAGRVVFVTDSAISGDGTDSHGNNLNSHDAFNDSYEDNRALFLNAIAWLGE